MTARNFTLGRPLGAGLLLGGLGLVALAAIGASWADLSAATEERDAKADLLERGIAAGRRAVAAPASITLDPFVGAETATRAAAKVDADLRTLALSSGLALLSSRADAKPEEPGAAASIGTRIEDQIVVEGGNEAVHALLAKLDGETPTMLVDGLEIAPAEAERSAVADVQAPVLRMSLTVSAYWRAVRPLATR